MSEWSRRTVAMAWLFGPAAMWGVLSLGAVVVTASDDEAWVSVDQRDADTAGSEACRRCHPAQYETWRASYHRTMTQWAMQPATSDAVLAPFSGETLDALGFRATMDRGPDGRPRITVTRIDAPGDVVLEADVELTVGSHRYQQYVARIDRGGGPDERWRLPIAWHVQTERYIHLGTAFLVPDGVPGAQDDYLRHLSRWNDNCLFCHNTEPSPGLQADGRYDTTFAELGIACEACHGPAAAHVARHEDPMRRMLSVQTGADGDGSIAHPGRMAADRSAEVCGRCHGNRIGRDMSRILAHGDGYVPGRPLSEVSRPIFADAHLADQGADARPFAPRFWPDRTPRLSAYEYQALLLSPCHDDGAGMTCGTCHTMHGPEPSMQLRPDYDPVGTCVGCHDAGLGADHGGHDTATGVDCAGCHLPRVTYGLLEGMMSHRITSPDPGALVGRDDQPDACTQCHVDRSRAWAAAAVPGLGLAGSVGGPPSEAEGWASRVELDLVGGDPIQRALAAHALGRPDAVGNAGRRRRALVDALEDEYPAVRWFAWRTLLSMGDEDVRVMLADFDVGADPATRLETVLALRAALGPSGLARDPGRMEILQARRDDRAIEIGE